MVIKDTINLGEHYCKKCTKDIPVQLLRTGGWDSSFRLMQITVLLKKEVQPYYIIDPGRKSVRYEMRAMQLIKADIKENFPEAGSMVKPTRFIERDSVDVDDQITNSYERVKEKYPIGIQYEWLARFAVQNNLFGLELAIEKSMDPNSIMNKILVRRKWNEQYTFIIDPGLSGTDEHILFKNFLFPIRENTKLDMVRIAKESGFYDIMMKTWFCHDPLPDGNPCGVCTPCIQLMKKGMGFRMPVKSKMRYHLRIFLSKEQLKKAHPLIYKHMSKVKKLFYKLK